MLAKKYRLPVRSVIGLKGLVRRGRYLTLKIFPAQRPYARFGVVVSAKVAPKAVERNRVRRALCGVAQPLLPTLPTAEYLLIAQSSAAIAGDAIIKELRSLLLNSIF